MDNKIENYLEDSLKSVNRKIQNKEDNVRGGLCMLGVGLAGIAYGVLTQSDSSIMSGMVVSSGSLLFRTINRISLDRLRIEQYVYMYALRHNNVDEYHFEENGGKHFKK